MALTSEQSVFREMCSSSVIIICAFKMSGRYLLNMAERLACSQYLEGESNAHRTAEQVCLKVNFDS